ncbi:MAG TPA: DUF3826 domain-containing protein, partial [Pseudomonadales bacterium]|nr:DUF3826 domain-containing protein [Pseudomonadales bacterium]
MKALSLVPVIALVAITSFCRPAQALAADSSSLSTPPVSADEVNAAYDVAVEKRTLKIMQALSISDAAKSNRVQVLIIANYHALRARDEAIDDSLSSLSADSSEWHMQKNTMILAMCQPFHDQFIAALSRELTPDQIETIKDQLTYGKVKFTYDAYCSIIPGLTDEQKAKILDLLKQARDMAMEGGSSGEKNVIFQKYKDQINAYLKTQGIDVDKAIQDWTKQQKALQKSPAETNPIAP